MFHLLQEKDENLRRTRANIQLTVFVWDAYRRVWHTLDNTLQHTAIQECVFLIHRVYDEPFIDQI
jgi:hypothetical protein